MDQEQMLAALKGRDHAAMRELVEAFGPRLLRSAYLLCGSEAEAQDLVQDTFLQALQSAHRFQGRSSIYTWLHAILLNLTRHFHRDRKKLVFDDQLARKDIPASEEGPNRLDADVASGALIEALDRLAAPQREVLILRFYENMRLDEIAAHLGVATGTVKSRLHYGLAEMQPLLPDELNLFGDGGHKGDKEVMNCQQFQDQLFEYLDGSLAATCAMAGTPADFPYAVPFKLGEAEFAPGDNITITQVRGTSSVITTNQTYSVDGTYTLASRDQADLCFFATTTQADPTPTDPRQMVRLTKGAGTFHLIKTMTKEGYLHLTFYAVPQGHGFGGVYFGQGQWVLSKKGWSYQDAPAGTAGASNLAGANPALYEYLGDPVPPPPGLDAKYTADGLSNAVQLAASKAGLSLTRLVIDDSEFPGIIAIVIPDGDIDTINNQIRAMAGYEYNGSISSSTCKVFNIVPWRAYPSEAVQRIHHRLGLREQALFDRMSATP